MVVPGSGAPKKFDPHSMIDFGIADGRALKLYPVDAIFHLKDKRLRKMLLNFDHFPIAYDIAYTTA